MTLVMAWRSKNMLTVCADTRIENGDPITDAGQKLFSVPIEVTPFGINEDVVRLTSIGFAFAGNTLLAQSCNAIASTALGSLGMADPTALAPDAIADLFAKAAEFVSQERRFLTPGSSAHFHSMIFGWDEAAGEPFVFEIEVRSEDGTLHAFSKRIEVSVGGLIYFGSGAPFIRNRIEELEMAQANGVRPHRLMEAALAESALRSVGGSLQFATAQPGGVRLRPMARIDKTGLAEMSILGCDIRRLMGSSTLFFCSGFVALPDIDD